MPKFSFPDRPRPRDPNPNEVAWVRHLMADERNALLLAPHGVVLYSMFTVRQRPTLPAPEDGLWG
ncbi:MAG: hypothetical protein ABWY71_00765 [Candidatus Saccharimonadales bacterium]